MAGLVKRATSVPTWRSEMLSACCTYTFFLVVFFLLVRPGGENTSVAFVVGEHWGVGGGSN